MQEQISGPRPDLPIPVGLSCVGLAMPLLLHLLDSNPFVDFRLVPLHLPSLDVEPLLHLCFLP